MRISMHSSSMRTTSLLTVSGGSASNGGGSAFGGGQIHIPPWTEWDRCKNITLPQMMWTNLNVYINERNYRSTYQDQQFPTLVSV